MSSLDEEIALSKPMRRAWLGEDERSVVYRSGDVVMRETGPWTTTVHSLLNHLEAVGFAYSPRVIGSGFTADGRETLSFIYGETTHFKFFHTRALTWLFWPFPCFSTRHGQRS